PPDHRGAWRNRSGCFPCRGPRPACPLAHPPAYLSHALARDALMLPGNADRRGLLRSVFGEWLERLVAETERKLIQRRYVRPPGALPEMGFLTACTRCGACAPVCPVQAIKTVTPDGGLAAGTPYLEPEQQPCIACADMPCAR